MPVIAEIRPQHAREQINLEGNVISYTLKRSARARNVRFEISTESGLSVVVPQRFKLENLASLLKSKQRWILKKLNWLQRNTSEMPVKEFNVGDKIPYLGREVTISSGESNGKAGYVSLNDGFLEVTTGKNISNVTILVYNWYRDEAQRFIEERTRSFSAVMGVHFNRITCRRAKTRWGSCSFKRNLSFNWKLITLPVNVTDYIIVHELAHLKEMNHSAKFWQIVAEYCPDWRKYRKWLKERETSINRRLPAWFN